MQTNLKPNSRLAKAGTLFFDYLVIFAGAVLYGISVAMFTSPNNVAPGGLTGVATMLNYMFSLPIGIMIFVMNIPLFIWGFIENGKGFLTRTLVATALVSVMIDVLTPILPAYTGDTILAAGFGGVLNGLGLGLIFYRGGSTGGTDIIALNLHKHFPFISTGTIILVSDILVLLMVFFVYHSIENVLYALLVIFISIKVIDAVSYGTSRGNGKLMFVISDNYEEVSANIMKNLKKRCNIPQRRGAYSGKDKKVIMCAVRPQEAYKITSGIKNVDPNAFIIVTTAGAIKGRGFVNIDSN